MTTYKLIGDIYPISYPLNLLSATSTAAYSLRLLSFTYTGYCIRVRRSSDNTTLDIGFVRKKLDTATLLSFCGSGNGFITIWYDQSGNGYNMVQATTGSQPQIVASGVVKNIGGNNAVYFSGSTYMQASSIPVVLRTPPWSTSCVVYPSTFSTSEEFLGWGGNGYTGARWAQSLFSSYSFGIDCSNEAVGMSATNAPVNTWYVVTTNQPTNSLSGCSLWTNGLGQIFPYAVNINSTFSIDSAGSFVVGINPNASNNFIGYISEIAIFGNTNISYLDRNLLDTNQKSYFSITGTALYPAPITGTTSSYPLSSVSVAPVLAYSLRLLSSTYIGYCIKVRRSSDNTWLNIGFVNGVLDTATLLSFCGSGNGFIMTWYDQSGNNNHVSQNTTANQPQIVASGSLAYTINSLPAIHFSPIGGTYLGNNTTTTNVSGITNCTLNMVVSYQLTNNTEDLPFVLGNSGVTASIRSFYRANSGTTMGFAAWTDDLASSSLTITNGAGAIFTAVQSAASLTMVKNGTTASYTLPGTPSAVAGCIGIGTPFNGNQASYYSDFYGSELIAFGSALTTTNRQALEHDQETYYSISGV